MMLPVGGGRLVVGTRIAHSIEFSQFSVEAKKHRNNYAGLAKLRIPSRDTVSYWLKVL